jgi:hypothetical protein
LVKLIFAAPIVSVCPLIFINRAGFGKQNATAPECWHVARVSEQPTIFIYQVNRQKSFNNACIGTLKIRVQNHQFYPLVSKDFCIHAYQSSDVRISRACFPNRKA